MNCRYLFLLLACFVDGQLSAQQVAPCRVIKAAPQPVDFFGTSDGLSQGMMNAMAMDSDGYLWLGTNAGLNRFDGRTFKVYRNRPTDTTSIASNHILGLYVDAQNRIWISTESMGVDCFDRTTETFTHYTTANGLSSNRVSNILKADNQGQVIIMHEDGKPTDIIIRKPGRGNNGFQVKRLTDIYPGFAKAAGNKESHYYCFTANGDMWFYMNDSICRLDKQALSTTGNYQTFANAGYATEMAGGFEFFLDAAKLKVYLPDSNGLSVYNEREKKFMPCMKLALGYKFWNRPYMDAEGRLWCTQPNGNLIRINNLFNQMEVIELTATPAVKQLFRAAYFTLLDKFGNMWLGTTGWGFFKINTRRELFKHAGNNGTDNGGPTYWQNRIVKPGVKALFDPVPYQKLISTFTKAGKKNTVQYLPRSINCDSADCYWLAAPSAKADIADLIKLDPKRNTWQVMNQHHGSSMRWFYVPLIIDKYNNLWFGERSISDSVRLYHFNTVTGVQDSFAFPVKYDVVSYEFIADWQEDREDKLWLATCKGLFVFNMQTHLWQTFADKKQPFAGERLLSICPDPLLPQRYLWIGSAGGGLNKLDKTTGKFINYTTARGLPDDIVYSIQTDADNNLWLGTGNGLCLFNPVTLQTTNFSMSDGLPCTDFNSGQYSKAASGELHFGCVGGHLYFNPEDFYKPTPTAKIAITQLKLLNKPVEYTPGNDSVGIYNLPIPIEQARDLVFNYDQRMISFNFSLLNLSNPTRNKYKYILLGLNEDWIDNGYNNEAVFTNLSPGKYTLKVMGQSSGTSWTVSPATLNITILPPWWATWWFRGMVIVFVAGLVYAASRYRLHQLLRMERMRNQIAQDLHDEIGSTLSSISLYGVVMQNSPEARSESTNSILNKIIESTSQMMESMNDMVWTIKADNDSFEQVVNRMRAFAVNVTEAKGIALNFNADKQVEQLDLNMNQRKNIYLIFKEAVNNAVKYSACKNLRINIADAAGALHLNVEDDGTGFDFDSTINNTQLLGGNGLRGMQARAKEIGGTLRIVSNITAESAEQGTCINFSMPV